MNQYRELHLRSAAGIYRTETYNDREYIVVPVVALMEGVIWASNAPKPEYVPLDTLKQSPDGWNGRPVMLDHPAIDGIKVTANTPEMLEANSFGQVFAAAIVGTKLTMEAWLDVAKAALIPEAQVLIDKIKAGEDIEVSIGAYIALSLTTGFFNNIEYFGVWVGLMPDHLALLPVGTLGACSNEMGCGVRTATLHTLTAKGIEMPGTAKPRGGIVARVMSALRSANLSPTVSDQDIKDELREALNKLEPNGAYIIAVYSDRVIFDVYESGDYCLYSRTYDDAYKLGDRVAVEFVGSYVPTETADAAATGDDLITAARRLLRASAGARHSATDVNDINSIHTLSVQLGAACSPTVVGASGTKPCGCGQPAAASTTSEGDGMKTKPERIAALMAHTHSAIKDQTILDTLSDAALTALEVSADAAKTAATPAVVPAPAAPAVPAALSEADVMRALPESVKRTLARAEAVEAAQKAAHVTALAAHSTVYSVDQLNAMTIDQLETLSKFAKLDTPAVDFGALPIGANRNASEITAPPDGYAPMLAEHSKTIQ